MTFPEPRWAVPGIVCEGVNLLAGAPKVGKSWLSLGIAVAVATGTPALGKVPVEAGPVLYLALEDTPRRIQDRLAKTLAEVAAPEGLVFWPQCPPLHQGGADHIDAWLTDHPRARLVIIDVFAKVRGNPPPGLSAYEADYRAVGQIKAIADAHHVAVVIVTHTRKADKTEGRGDFLEEVSGTNGQAGAADATLVLKRSRGTADAVLHVTGRDIEEAQHAMSFVADTGAWQLLDGAAIDHTVTDTRAAILTHLRANPGHGPTAVAAALAANLNTVKATLTRMAKDGQLTTDGHGHYYPPTAP